ncbi:unnamed protein product, partial [Cylicostephanus goldi]
FGISASQGVTDDSTSFSTRLKNIIYTYLSYYFQLSAAKAAEKVMVEKLGKSITPIWDTVSNMTWMLTNTEPMLEFAKPTLHKIVDIGGISVHKPKPLEKVCIKFLIVMKSFYFWYWDQILGMRYRTILISFGSVLQSSKMPDAYKRAVMNLVKSHSDITFIWKYENTKAPFANGLKNLILSKYTTAARRIRNLLAKRPFTPEEKLVKTVEVAAEFGHIPEYLVMGRNLNFIVYYNLDIFLLLLTFCLVTALTILYGATKLLKRIKVEKVKAE